MPHIDSSYLKNLPSSDVYGDEDGFDMGQQLGYGQRKNKLSLKFLQMSSEADVKIRDYLAKCLSNRHSRAYGFDSG